LSSTFGSLKVRIVLVNKKKSYSFELHLRPSAINIQADRYFIADILNELQVNQFSTIAKLRLMHSTFLTVIVVAKYV